VEDDQGSVGRGPGGQRGQVGEQVAAMHGRRVTPGSRDRRGQPFLAVAFPGPHQAGQPADVVVSGHIKRVEVEPGPPGDVGQPDGHGHRPAQSAVQRRRVRVGTGDQMPVVVVGVAVEQQREPGTGADLDQRQRPGQPGERGEQGGAAGGLVRLGEPGQHDLGQFGLVPPDQGLQRADAGRDAQQVPGRGEQQIRLAFGRRQRSEKTQDHVVIGDRRGQ